MGPNPVSSSRKAVYEDEMGLTEGSAMGRLFLIPGLTRNLPNPRLQKRPPVRRVATYAPSRSGVCCIWKRPMPILKP